MLPTPSQNSETGLWGEQIAAASLAKNGYVIVGRRVRPDKHDEIDIIARKGPVLAFVEVKTRSGESFGRPFAAVNASKRRALCRAAAAFLRHAGYPNLYYRFDVVEVVGRVGDTSPTIRIIEDAFRFPTYYRFARQRPEEAPPTQRPRSGE